MKHFYVLLIPLLSSFAYGAQAVSTAPFSLEKRGDQVCRIKSGSPEVCLPSVAAIGNSALHEINVRERIRQYGLFLELKKSVPDLRLSAAGIDAFGGAIFLSPQQVATTLGDFEELIVRDVAVSNDVKKSPDGSIILPFVASLRWKSLKNLKPNGTLFIEGYIKTREGFNHFAFFNPTDSGELRRRKINELFDIEGFADSRTEKQIDFLRNLENLGREVHFRAAGTQGKSVEGATLDLLNQVVAPVVFGEAFWLPEMKRSGADVNERLQLK